MKKYQGKSVSEGIAIGKLRVYSGEQRIIEKRRTEDVDRELGRFEDARASVALELSQLYQETARKAGDQVAAIFQGHSLILQDEVVIDFIREMIRTQKVDAESAVAAAGEKFAGAFEQLDDPYFKERAADVKDVKERVLRKLRGGSEEPDQEAEGPAILAARELTPSQTVRMDPSKILGFVTEFGSANSHVAILSRAMGIVALTGIRFTEEMDGKLAVLDGFSGELILEPDETTLAGYQEKQKGREERQKLLAELRGKEDVTADGRRMDLFANVGSLEEVKRALENDARGIGLFRTEFLYLGKTEFPSEEEQFQAYKEALEQMEGKKVIIRTLDVGADKQTDYLQMEPEANPALGCRGIRLCLRRPDIFKTQLRALVRASAYGNLGILYPMIISVDEIRQIKALVNEVKSELEEEGISYGTFEQGVMIETPAAVMISSALAKEVDFFSIGTNDLTQYTLAVDRQDVKLDDLFDPRHPAVMDLIRMTVKNGHAGGCRVGICGELGADPALTGTFLEMGVDELSVTPASVLQIRKIIRAI